MRTALVATLATGASQRGLSPVVAAAQQPTVSAASLGDQPARGPRPFDHARHDRVSCRACHGTGAEHRTMLIRSARDCAGCHHDPRREMECTSCHARDALPALQRISTSVRLPPSGNARTRVLPFRHEIHLTAGRVCRDCHREDVTLKVDRECASCHASHHTATAECAMCHVAPKAGAHDAGAHLSCAGGGCHASATAPPPNLSRNLCLACHEAQQSHEPGGVCADCHRIPGPRQAEISAGAQGRHAKGRQ
jgi:hypothetical protein